MNARSCPTCRSVGSPRMVGEDVDDLAYCPDTWHAPSPDTGGAMVSTASLPTHIDPAGPALAFEVRFKPGADSDDSLAVIKAVLTELDGQVAEAVTVTDVARLHEELRQANLRHRMAERECADLRVDLTNAQVIVERRGRIIADMRASGSELIVARDAALAEVERMRGMLGETLGCFDTVTDAGATGWIDSATYARVQSAAGLS